MSNSFFSGAGRDFARNILRGSRIVHVDDVVEIISVESKSAAEFWFFDARWCVKENPWFEEYLEDGPLFLFFSAKRKRDYLLAPASGEFRNHRNRSVRLPVFIKEHPSAALPLRREGVFWHNEAENQSWSNNIYYCPPP